MKVRLFGIDEDGNRQFKGYFTAKDGKAVFFPSGSLEPLSDQQFVDMFGDYYPALIEGAGSVKITMHEPELYLKHLGQRYHGQVWVEVSSGRGRRCPECGSHKVVKIIYGMPAPLPEGADPNDWRNKQILGGCCVIPGAPKWGCTDCGTQF